ncbi:MAG: flagellar biosynthesis anti-sigma factor FlgM [Armatimonadetes bacterium]|nr:flagellar biosynthesis anti-sigma factor FlgM [Armatimonadota bacterium]
MKISDREVENVLKVYRTERAKVEKERKAAESDKTKSSSPLSLSTKAEEIKIAKRAMRSASEVREDKVRELSERIHRGEYEVAAEWIAERMMSPIGGTVSE